MAVGVRQGSAWLWQGTNAGAFDLQDTSITKGSSIDFVVSGGYGWGNTPLEVTIFSAIPEPETYAMLLAGLGLMGFIARCTKQEEAVAV